MQKTSMFNPYATHIQAVLQDARALAVDLVEFYMDTEQAHFLWSVPEYLASKNQHGAAAETIRTFYRLTNTKQNPIVKVLFDGQFGWVFIELFITEMKEMLDKLTPAADECLYHRSAKELITALTGNGGRLIPYARRRIESLEIMIARGEYECAVMAIKDLYRLISRPYPSELDTIPSQRCFMCILDVLMDGLPPEDEEHEGDTPESGNELPMITKAIMAEIWVEIERNNVHRRTRPGMVGCCFGPNIHIVNLDEFCRSIGI